MHAIEFETRVEDRAVQLPENADLADGQIVRVVLMYDAPPQPDPIPGSKETAKGTITRMMRNPVVLPGFAPMTRYQMHER